MRIICLLLLPILAIGQNYDFPDTLYLKTGSVHECLIQELEETYVKLLCTDNTKSAAMLKDLKKISLNEKGVIYSNEDGYLFNTKELNPWIKSRNKSIRKDRKLRESIAKQKSSKERKRWSFGIDYCPLYFESKTYIDYTYYNNVVLTMESRGSTLESLFSYSIHSRFWLTSNISYYKSYLRRKYEYHYVRENIPDDSGYEDINEMDILMVILGGKYYLSNIFPQRVSAYFSAGIGKQFAFVTDEYKDLYEEEEEPDVEIKDNFEEYLEQLNSPTLINIGFGAEYFFNESISLSSNFRFIFRKIYGKYKYEESGVGYNDEYYSKTRKSIYEKSDIQNRISLGINFYF